MWKKKNIVDNYRAMFESRISAVDTEKLPYSENFRTSSCSYDMQGHAKKCVNDIVSWQRGRLYKVSTPYIGRKSWN